jgi:arylsulfatase A-like enzyme
MWQRILASRWFYIVAGTLMVAAFLASQVRFGSDSRPKGSPTEILELGQREDLNLLFILIDTLRSDRLGTYGYERDTSPVIDELARTGLRFARQQSQSSWTKCSMASLWTGLYPIRTGVLRSPNAIPDAARMPAEILSDAGFRTFAIWRNGWISPQFGFSQGFEEYFSPPRSPVPATVRRENPVITLAGTDQDTARSAIEFLRIHGHERWFLYLHLMDVHQYVYDEDTALFGTSYSDARTENVDLWPTVLDLLDLPPLQSADGRSRIAEIEIASRAVPEEDAPADDGLRFAHIDQAWGRTKRPPRPMVAVNEGAWRLIYRTDRPARAELYEIYGDPLEQQNRAAEEPEVLSRLKDHAQAYFERPPAPWGDAVDVELSEEELQQLRALGYDVGGGS